MHVEPIAQAAVAGQPAPPPPPVVNLNEVVQQARQAAIDARQDAQQSAQEEGHTFRIEKDGKVVTVGPDGVIVTNAQAGLPAAAPSIPPEAVGISIAFFLTMLLIAIGWPIARAIARRMDRTTAAPAHAGADNSAQLRRIEQAVEAMAIEVERVSENQRFVTKLLSEGRPDEALLAQASGGRKVSERAMPDAPSPR